MRKHLLFVFSEIRFGTSEIAFGSEILLCNVKCALHDRNEFYFT